MEADMKSDKSAQGYPRTMKEKIDYLLGIKYPGSPPTDRQVVEDINAYAREHGLKTISHTTFWKLHSGEVETATPKVLQTIASWVGVDPKFLEPLPDVVQTIIENLRFLRSIQRGDVTGIAARGLDDAGLSAELLAYLNDVSDSLDAEAMPGDGRPDTAFERPSD